MTEKHPIDVLQEALHETEEKADMWKLCTGAASFCAVVAFVLLGIGLHFSLQMTVEVSKYRQQCVAPETAEALVSAADQVSMLNERCLASHDHNISVLKKALPGLFIEDKAEEAALYVKRSKRGKRRKRKSKKQQYVKPSFGQTAIGGADPSDP